MRKVRKGAHTACFVLTYKEDEGGTQFTCWSLAEVAGDRNATSGLPSTSLCDAGGVCFIRAWVCHADAGCHSCYRRPPLDALDVPADDSAPSSFTPAGRTPFALERGLRRPLSRATYLTCARQERSARSSSPPAQAHTAARSLPPKPLAPCSSTHTPPSH